MATLDIFVSFEFDKDRDLKDNFYKQAKTNTRHRLRNCSLNEVYPDESWKSKAPEAIKECDVLVVLIGQDTHNAPGVKVETDMARSFDKPIRQIRPKDRPYNGLPHHQEPIPWDWKKINTELDAVSSRSS